MPIYLGNKKISYQQHVDYNKGSGDTPSSGGKKTVNFYDYDGTLLHSYTREEALGLSELPSLPDRTAEGLTCQGWNWTLSDIQNELKNREDLDYLAVGATYITTDGATHINITFADKYRSKMRLWFTGNVTIDWGDGNTQTVNHTFATTVTHEYAIAQSYPVKYTIKLTVNSGTLAFGGGSSSYNICGNVLQSTSNPTRSYSSRIDSVFIGNNVKSIGGYAFQQCYSLASVTIPNSVTSISAYAFSSCYSLTSITIPNNVTSIGKNAFYYCYSLTSITIPNSITSIGTYAFQGCSSLTSITIPNSITSISNYAFASCDSLASIVIPNSVTSIGNYAFSSCYSLASITIPNSVTSIGTYAFSGCRSLTSITIPSSVTSIGERAFEACCSLASVTIPDGVTSIDSGVIQNCFSLTSIAIPDSVTSIGDYAFRNCYDIIKYDFSTHTAVPTLSSIHAFYNIATDAKIVVPDALYDEWIAATNWATYKSYIVKVSEYAEPRYVPPHTIITYTDGSTTEVEVGDDGVLTQALVRNAGDYTTIQSAEIGSDVTSIGNYVFNLCTNLTSVTIPKSVTLIEASAFRNCSGLTLVTIPASVTTIEMYAFSNCSSLTSVTIPEGVTEIGTYVFDGCANLTSITIPSSVTSIGDYAFYICSGLTNIILENRTLEEAQSLIGTTNSISYSGTVTYNGGTYTTIFSNPSDEPILPV